MPGGGYLDAELSWFVTMCDGRDAAINVPNLSKWRPAERGRLKMLFLVLCP